MRATIKEKQEVAKGTLYVTFDLLGEEVDFEPGQYFWVELLDPPYSDERGPRRHITVVTSPTQRGILGLATRIRDTAFKRSLVELPVGAPVDVEQPKGSFTLPDPGGPPVVFIAGGIGITPFISMLRFMADTGRSEPVTLLYSNRDTESAAFLDELTELARRLPNLEFVPTMTGEPDFVGENRRIDEDFLRDRLGDLSRYRFMVAGPPQMADGVVGVLNEAGVPEEQVARDGFSGY
jgi:ferredoxin-NADP reductase